MNAVLFVKYYACADYRRERYFLSDICKKYLLFRKYLMFRSPDPPPEDGDGPVGVPRAGGLRLQGGHRAGELWLAESGSRDPSAHL